MSERKECMTFFKIKNIHPEKSEKAVSEARRSLYEIFKKYQ